MGPAFAFAAWLGLGPGPVWLAAAGFAVTLLAIRRAGRTRVEGIRLGPEPGLASRAASAGARAVGWALLGVASVTLLAGVAAWPGGGVDPVPPERASAIYELDARIATRPLPACRPRVRESRVLLERGAHPRFTADGTWLWFDAPGPDGRRQVHRMDARDGSVVCWTCDEPGNNRWPAPGEGGRGVAFESDRNRHASTPLDSEIHLISGLGAAPSAPSVRLTLDPGADLAPLLGPGGQLLVWSRYARGRYELVGAPIHQGHGGVLLGEATRIVEAGLDCVLPVAWSPEARSLVYVRGNPIGPQALIRLDPASGERTSLGGGAAPVPAGFSADGGWLVAAATGAGGGAARLPAWLGFLVGPVAWLLGVPPDLVGSGLRAGEPWGEGAVIALGDVAEWGVPTGVALAPDGRSAVLGQRRETPSGVEERLLRVRFDCAETSES